MPYSVRGRGCPWGSRLLSALRSVTMRMLRAWTGEEGERGDRGAADSTRDPAVLCSIRDSILPASTLDSLAMAPVSSSHRTSRGETGHARQLKQAKRQAKQKAKEGLRGSHFLPGRVALFFFPPPLALASPPVAPVELSVRGRKRDGPRWLQVPWCPASTPCRPVF